MKIIQVCPKYFPDIGGVEIHVKLISEELAKRGFDVEVVCTDPRGTYPKEEEIHSVKIRRFRAIAPNESYFFAPQISNYIKNTSCDVIHVHNYHALPALFSAFAKRNRKFIFTPHTFGFGKIEFSRRFLLTFYKPLGRYVFNKSDLIISISKIERKFIETNFGSYEKIYYIPSPIKIEKVNRNRCNNETINIVYVGRLSKEKNVDVLIRSFKRVKQIYPMSRLYILGSGPLEQYVRNLIKVEEGIFLLGRLTHEKVMKFLDTADLFVLPSKFEVLPLSILEAMSKQVPVIVTPVGELPHILRHKKTCLFVKINDYKDLANKIINIIENKNLAKKLAKNARKYVEKNHDITKIINKYIKIYEEI